MNVTKVKQFTLTNIAVDLETRRNCELKIFEGWMVQLISTKTVSSIEIGGLVQISTGPWNTPAKSHDKRRIFRVPHQRFSNFALAPPSLLPPLTTD